MKTLIPLLLIMVSCSEDLCEVPDFEAAGLKICTDGNSVDPEEIEFIAKTVEQEVREVYPQVPSNTFKDYKRNDIRVQFIDATLLSGCEEIGGGLYQCEKTIGGRIVHIISVYRIYVRYRKCLVNSSFDHELLHAIEHLYLGGPQGKDRHSTPYMFQIDAEEQGIDFQDTIERKIYKAVEPVLQSCQ